VYRCSFMKTLPCYGKLYISPNYICFNSRALATRAKVYQLVRHKVLKLPSGRTNHVISQFIVPLQDIATVQKLRTRGYFFYGLSILTHNKKEVCEHTTLHLVRFVGYTLRLFHALTIAIPRVCLHVQKK
jgi:hypothetical protein